MAINPVAMGRASSDFGEILKNDLNNEPPPRPLLVEGPLSRDLASTHPQFAHAAAEFVPAKNRGIDAFTRGIAEITRNYVEYDNQSAEAIQRLFAEPPPDPAGGP